jgi:hypothetical protein
MRPLQPAARGNRMGASAAISWRSATAANAAAGGPAPVVAFALARRNRAENSARLRTPVVVSLCGCYLLGVG